MSDHSDGVHLLCHSCTEIIKKHKAMLRELAERNVVKCLVCNGKGLTKGWDGTKDVCQTCAGVGVHPKETKEISIDIYESDSCEVVAKKVAAAIDESTLGDKQDAKPYTPPMTRREQIQRTTHMPIKRRGRPPKKK